MSSFETCAHGSRSTRGTHLQRSRTASPQEDESPFIATIDRTQTPQGFDFTSSAIKPTPTPIATLSHTWMELDGTLVKDGFKFQTPLQYV